MSNIYLKNQKFFTLLKEESKVFISAKSNNSTYVKIKNALNCAIEKIKRIKLSNQKKIILNVIALFINFDHNTR
jgi:hypothetical protein